MRTVAIVAVVENSKLGHNLVKRPVNALKVIDTTRPNSRRPYSGRRGGPGRAITCNLHVRENLFAVGCAPTTVSSLNSRRHREMIFG